MEFDLDQRSAALSVGEFSTFVTGPRDASGGPQGVWRAQLGTHWHRELRSRAAAEAPATEFELPLSGRIVHHGWTLTLTGRLDQVLRSTAGVILREIKTVSRELPADESELRQAYPDYFAQLATYAVLTQLGGLGPAPGGSTVLQSELCFLEIASGLAQTVTLTPDDQLFHRVQLERVTEFLDLRLRARERLKNLRFRAPFARLRPGQETTEADLSATFSSHPLVLFEAPTGFGKTGVLLEFALGQLRSGHFDRVLYLTSKSTGQLQVVRTLATMTVDENGEAGAPGSGGQSGGSPPSHDPSRPAHASGPPPGAGPRTPVAVWHVRNKSEHCINHTFHCVRDTCAFLADAAVRWPASGLARFYLDERQARDLETLRAAGVGARICPYEITRAALAFNDVWIGDYNYVFAPRNRGLFFDQPGFAAARTLLLLDEAHNLPSRVADVYSRTFTAGDAYAVRDELHRTRPMATLVTAWDHWCHFLDHLRASHGLAAEIEDDARHLLGEIARLVPTVALDLATLGPRAADLLWDVPSFTEELGTVGLPRLWWAARDGELSVTCLDAAPAIGAALREFGGVVLASATLSPIDGFAAACGLDVLEAAVSPPRKAAPAPPEPPAAEPAAGPPERLGKLNKRVTRTLYRQLTTGAALLRVEEARDAARPTLLRAHAPWREGSYDVAFDARVDTTFQHRSQHFTTTAATIAALHQAATRRASGAATAAASGASASGCVAVFFPSYAYAEALKHELTAIAPDLSVALQPRLRDLAAQSAWVEQSMGAGGALFLVLGSSFAESIDALGGRVGHALVVGPALPEVNPVQRARLAEAGRAGLGRDEAFRRVYQIPGMTKVNQALGRLVRAPGQRARVVLHCRRFLETSYQELLAQDYRTGVTLHSDADLAAWLGSEP